MSDYSSSVISVTDSDSEGYYTANSDEEDPGDTDQVLYLTPDNLDNGNSHDSDDNDSGLDHAYNSARHEEILERVGRLTIQDAPQSRVHEDCAGPDTSERVAEATAGGICEIFPLYWRYPTLTT